MMLMSKKSEPEMSDESDSEDAGSYDELADELGDILGLDSEKAHRLRDVICSLAREEMEGGGDDEESPDEGSKKPSGIAILLSRKGR